MVRLPSLSRVGINSQRRVQLSSLLPQEVQVVINRVITSISVPTSTEMLGIVLAEMYVHKSLSFELYNGSKSIK